MPPSTHAGWPNTTHSIVALIALGGFKWITGGLTAGKSYRHGSTNTESGAHQARRQLAARRRVSRVRPGADPGRTGRAGSCPRPRPCPQGDRALLLFGFVGALRRCELVALRVEDVAIVAGDLRLRIMRGKTDQAGQGAEVARGRHVETYPCVRSRLGRRSPVEQPGRCFENQHGEWVTDRLRQVAVRTQASSGRRLPNGRTVIDYGFFSSGETPQVAITRLEVDWPRLRFQLVHRPTD